MDVQNAGLDLAPTVKEGDVGVFIDENLQRHPALVTAVFPDMTGSSLARTGPGRPGVNLSWWSEASQEMITRSSVPCGEGVDGARFAWTPILLIPEGPYLTDDEVKVLDNLAGRIKAEASIDTALADDETASPGSEEETETMSTGAEDAKGEAPPA